MNSVYITAGVVIILALLTALVGPLFVDWTAYRSTFETYAEQALGHKVTVLGKADMSLLPAPTLTFTDVRVGEAEDPLLIVSRFEMQVELPPLLRGEIRVLDMRLERPQLTLAMDEYGRLDWLTDATGSGALAKIDPRNIAFDQIEVDTGAITLLDARDSSSHKLENVNVAISARSLKGPFKVDGSLIHDGNPYSLRLTTGEHQADGTLRLRADLVPALQALQVTLDGTLKQEAGAPGFDGRFTASSIGTGQEPDSWRAEGSAALTADGVEVPAFDLRIGPEDRAISLKGEARVGLAGQRRFEIKASAKQIDFDRIYGEGPQKPVALDRARSEMIQRLATLPPSPLPGLISLEVPAIVLGGGILQSTRLDVETTLGGWRVTRLASRLPGRAELATQGELGTSRALAYTGTLSFNVAQPQAFLAWFNQTPSTVQSGGPLGIDGRIALQPGQWSMTGARLDIGGATATGSVSYAEGTGGRGRLALSLDASRLDFDQLGGLTGLFRQPDVAAALASSDISLGLSAREILIRGIAGKALSVQAELAGDNLTLTSLSAADFAGARIEAKGAIEDVATSPAGRITAAIEASSLAGLVALAEDLAPEAALTAQLARAADHLVPARLEASLEARTTRDGSESELTVAGSAAGGTLRLDGRFSGRTDAWRDGDVAASLALEGPDGALLLRQLGLPLTEDSALAAGEITASLNGQPAKGMALSLRARAGETRIDATGDLQLVEGAAPRYTAAVQARADDLAPVALLWDKVLPVLSGEIGMDLAFELVGEGASITLDDLKGTVAGVDIEGRLAGNLAPADATGATRLTGALDFSALDVRVVSELVLGADQWLQTDADGGWPKAAFGPVQLPNLDLALDLRAEEAFLSDTLAVSRLASKLRLKPDLLRLEAIDAGLAGGKITGNLALTRSGAEAGLSGTLQVAGARLEELVWEAGGRAVATGQLDASGEFQSSGRSISALVAALAGGGTLQLSGAELRAMNPAAFDLVIRAADAGLVLEDDKIREVFASQLDAGSLELERLDGTLALNGGRLALRNVAASAEGAELTGQALLNLNDWTLDSDITVKVDAGSNATAGAEPQAALLFSGDLAAPERSIDVAPFTAFLTLRSFEQEVERVERLQAEILERDRLMREVKYFREEALRRQQERAAQAVPAAAETPVAPAATDPARPAPAGTAPAPDRPASQRPAPDRAAPDRAAPDRAAPARQGAAVSPAPQESGRDAIGDLLNFEQRIRSAIGTPAPAGVLQPLEPAREVGAGLQPNQILESRDPLLQPPQPPAQATQQRPRPQQGAAAAAAAPRPGPRYVTDPNGLVITYPPARN
nr:AsmA family protein [Pannonibacter sp. XCT-34]